MTREQLYQYTMGHEDYIICTREASPYTFNSTDNKHYDKVVRIETSDYYKCYELEIRKEDFTNTVLLIVPFYTPTDFCVVNGKGLLLMLNTVICLFDPKTLEITAKKNLNTMGSMFHAYPYKEDYILYGEIDIYRLTSELDVKWKFSARDIFVRYHGEEPAFEMKEDRICLIDFLDNYYEIDYDGKVIADQPLVR